jgi:hypothetical protein
MTAILFLIAAAVVVPAVAPLFAWLLTALLLPIINLAAFVGRLFK